MVTNNTNVDVKTKCIQENITQAQIAEKIGVTPAYVSTVIRKKDIINKTFVSIMEALGYDIQIVYVKKADQSSEM